MVDTRWSNHFRSSASLVRATNITSSSSPPFVIRLCYNDNMSTSRINEMKAGKLYSKVTVQDRHSRATPVKHQSLDLKVGRNFRHNNLSNRA